MAKETEHTGATAPPPDAAVGDAGAAPAPGEPPRLPPTATALAGKAKDAQLQGASLNYAELQGASLAGAQLEGASLANAFAWRADARQAAWKDTRVVYPEPPERIRARADWTEVPDGNHASQRIPHE